MTSAHNPACDCSYSQAPFMSSSSSEMLFYPPTGPADLGGSVWDATGEGQQNFAEFSTDLTDLHADAEDHGFAYGHTTPRKDQPDGMDGLPSNWALPDASLPGAEPMRRGASKSSNGSRKHRTLRASSAKARPSISSSASSRGPSHMSSFDMTGNSYAVAGGSLSHTRIMGVNQQYLLQDPDSLPLYPGLMGLATDGLSYPNELGAVMAQHVDPTCTQMHMDFEPSLPGTSPGSWSSSGGSRRSSPGPLDGTWSPQMASPADTYNSSSPEIQSESPRTSRKYNDQIMSEDVGGLSMAMAEGFALPPTFTGRRPSSEGESARDHPLYKDVQPSADGLYHCPWEGNPVCNHKAEKLKCNYDKFVDSHLKPYRCKHDSCENAKFSSTACLLRHEREAHAMHGHGDKPYLCTYDGCDRSVSGNGFPRQWNLRDHMRRVHHDNGPVPAPAPASPPPSSASNTKTRKKSSRKTSLKAEKPSASNRAAVEAAANHKFRELHKELVSTVSTFTTPDDPHSLQRIQEAQDQLSALSQISLSMRKPDSLQGSHQRPFAHLD